MRIIVAAALAAALAAAAAPLAAAPIHTFDGLALTAAGDRTATIEGMREPDAAAEPHNIIVVRSAATGQVLARIDPCPTCGYSGLAFAPDGRLALVARDRKAGAARLMVTDGGRTRTLATVPGIVNKPRWSPDGRTLAFLATVGATKETGAVQAGARQVGEIGTSFDEQRIAVVPAAGVPKGDTVRLVSPADRFVYEYDWTPDGRGFVATSAKGDGDANWWVATLDAIDLASGRRREIARPATQLNYPRISPDGRTVAFIGGLMSDNGSVGGDVWTVPFAGGTPRDATPGWRGSFTSLFWDRAGLRGTALIGDKEAVVPVDPARGAGAPLWSAAVSSGATDGKVALAGGRMAMAASDFEHATAIFAGPIARPVQVTHDNDGFVPLVRARSLTWRNGGFTVQGWLLAPVNAPATGRQPMIVEVHGGPAAAHIPTPVWQGDRAALARAGYWQFLPNPRGSYGQGEAFTEANRRDFGGGDFKDIMAGVDATIAQAPIDPDRLGLTGGSYGGFMAMWVNGQTDRFKAIHAAAGLSDWISYYGTNGINAWMIPYFGKSAYDDFDAYWRVSPVRYVRNAKTPTLITVGERDIEVPPTQSVEWWNGLKAQGVPTSLVIYPDEGHGLRDLAHVADERARTIAWFDRYVKGSAR